jgi:hypothetical protein
MQFIKPAAIRKMAKAAGRRVGKDFLMALENFVGRKVEIALTVKNGTKITLDADVAVYVGVK